MAKDTKATSTKPTPKEAVKLALAGYNMAMSASTNVWQDVKNNVDKPITKDMYRANVNLCRFFYRTEPIVATVINKLVEIGINDIIMSKEGLTDNEFRIFLGLRSRLQEFCETMAQELLISGLVVPEIGYGKIDKEEITDLGIKKYDTLVFPTSMWVRDPNSVEIISSLMMTDTPSYYIEIPDEIIFFIKNGGKYPNGDEDVELFKSLKTYFPDFVKTVLSGKKKVLLDNTLIIRRKYLSDNPYPIPYLSSALDALQHKRRMRRMDYSIMDKVISAIMHIKMGSDEFPIVAGDDAAFSSMRNQLMLRFQSDQNLERIFQLITNHTVEINWVFPDTSLLSDEHRYDGVNEEILFGLGFPRVLITGETARTGTSNPEVAILSPLQTMEFIRKKLLYVVRDIVRNVAELNNLTVPTVSFKALNLHSFEVFMNSLEKLYNISGVSRSSVAEYLGYDFLDEVGKLEQESKIIEEKGLSQFGQQAFGKAPNEQPAPNNPAQKPQSDTQKAPKKTSQKPNSQ